MGKRFLLILICIGLMTGVEEAQSVTFSGFLNNPGNPALIGSAFGPPLFGNDFEIANNVALYVISVAQPGAVRFLSKGFAAGGVDPYFTLFQSTGNSATFLGSNFTKAFSTGGDFDLSFTLAPGDYTMAIGIFANMSFPENLGTGTLKDGFISLGEPNNLGTYYYELEVGVPAPAGIPALTEWGMIILTTFLGLGALYPLGEKQRGEGK